MRTIEPEPDSPPPLSPLSDFSTLSSSLDSLSFYLASSPASSASALSDDSASLVGRHGRTASFGSTSSGSSGSEGSYGIIRSEDVVEEEDDEEEVILISRSMVRTPTPCAGAASPGVGNALDLEERRSISPLFSPNVSDIESDYLSSGQTTPTRSSISKRSGDNGSIISDEDAQSSIDEFLLYPGRHLDKTAKLRLWQSLCYELGLAYFPHDAPCSSPSSSRCSTPTQDKPLRDPIPMPQSLTKCEALLKARGHVNIHDYFRERQTGTFKRASGCGKYAHLVYPSSNAMCKYTKTSRKFAPLRQVKLETLQPLLRTMFPKTIY